MTKTSSTGGKIVQTKTGLIHHANTDRLITESENEHSKQNLAYDFSQFNTPIPVNIIPGRVVIFK